MVFYREVFSQGTYPATVAILTPIGKRIVHLFHIEDLSTLNLIFCRQDYLVPKKLDVIVDIGANIGLSTLFWLTRNSTSIVYLYEPVPTNLERLKLNIFGLEVRCTLEEVAISDFRGQVEFGVEETGKLGGIGIDARNTIQVGCIHIMDVIDPILQRHGKIDCLKIDTEGQEIPILKAIDPKCWKFIRCVNIENYESLHYMPSYFTSSKRGSAMRFINNM